MITRKLHANDKIVLQHQKSNQRGVELKTINVDKGHICRFKIVLQSVQYNSRIR
jgi:hypothetical protein